MTILSESSVNCSVSTLVVGIVATIVAFVILYHEINFGVDNFGSVFKVIMGTTILGCGMGSIICACNDRYTEYKVVLNDTYPAKEFLSKYELIDIDGEIYVVKEKEEEQHNNG